MSCFCSEHYVQLVGSDEAALGPEITLQCWGVTLAKHRRRRQGWGGESEEWVGRYGHTHWDRGKEKEEEEGRETLLGDVTASSHHLLSASSNTCHRTPTHVFLPSSLSFLFLHTYTFPLFFSLITLSISAPRLCCQISTDIITLTPLQLWFKLSLPHGCMWFLEKNPTWMFQTTHSRVLC